MLAGEHGLYLKRRGLAAGTIDKRLRRLAVVETTYGLATVTTEQIEELLDRRKISVKTRYDWISDLHCFYRWAIDWGHLTEDPTNRIVRPRLPRRLPRPIATGDLATAVQMAGPTMRSWLSLAAFGGLRCVEIARLEVDCLLWDDHLIRVLGKRDKERLVPMHPEVERVLRSNPMPSRGRVFRRPRGGGYPPAQISREVSLYLSSIGINATAHQLRHWFGTNVFRSSGRDLRVTQELLGHSSPQTTAIYADWSRPAADRAVAELSLDIDPTLFSEWAS